MDREVIRVVDTNIFEKRLKTAEAIIPFAFNFLTIKKYVAKFLEKSEATIDNMIADGRLIEGIHYTREKKIQFVPQAIVEYKIAPPVHKIKKYEPSGMAKEILK